MMQKQLSIPTQNIQAFQFKTHEIRTELINFETWWCLTDVCKVLEIKDPSRAADRLNPKGTTKSSTLTDGGKQELLFINESNLYKLIFRSNKPEARAFEDWVTGEVLPAIRKTGSYSVSGQLVSGANQLDAPSTKEDRKPLSNLVNVLVSAAPISHRDAWHMVHARMDGKHADELTLAEVQTALNFVQSKIDLYCASPEVDFITRQALAGVKSFTARLTVEETVSKTAKAVHREFKANIYIVEEKPKHEIAAYLDAMTDSHQKRINRAGIR